MEESIYYKKYLKYKRKYFVLKNKKKNNMYGGNLKYIVKIKCVYMKNLGTNSRIEKEKCAIPSTILKFDSPSIQWKEIITSIDGSPKLSDITYLYIRKADGTKLKITDLDETINIQDNESVKIEKLSIFSKTS